MSFEKLKRLSLRNEIRVDNTRGFKRVPPYYYDSLRHALQSYFNTFITHNTGYSFYAQGLYGKNGPIHKRDCLDEDNTVLALIAFERFFELFVKGLLQRVHRKLVCYVDPKVRGYPKNTLELVTQIQTKTFIPRLFDGKTGTIPFKITLQRFYNLLDCLKDPALVKANPLIRKFKREMKLYMFFELEEHKAILELLNWYRDNLLHNGNRLPTLWLLDYLVTQKIVPLVSSIIAVEKKNLGKALFYLETLTGINILNELNELKFKFRDLTKLDKQQDVFYTLLKIGHLKELGRASYNMNLYLRMNHATYEYSYSDPKGRGRRFAEIELEKCSEAIEIKTCPCCAEQSLVVYRRKIPDAFNQPNEKNIDWIKCYTCEYYIWYEMYDPSVFGLVGMELFPE